MQYKVVDIPPVLRYTPLQPSGLSQPELAQASGSRGLNYQAPKLGHSHDTHESPVHDFPKTCGGLRLTEWEREGKTCGNSVVVFDGGGVGRKISV